MGAIYLLSLARPLFLKQNGAASAAPSNPNQT